MKSNRSIHLALALGALAAVPALAAAQTGSSGAPQQRESGAQGGAQQQQGGAQQQQRGAQQQGSAQQGGQPGASGGERAQRKEEGQKDQGQKDQGKQKQAMRLHERISYPVEDGCTYTASVDGKIEQTKAGKSQQPSGAQPGDSGQGRGGPGAQGRTGGAAQDQDSSGRQAQAGAQAGGQAGAGDQEKVKPNLTLTASVSCPDKADIRVKDTLKTDTPITRSELEDMISRRTSITTEKDGRFCMYVPQFEVGREKLSGRGVAQLCRVPSQGQKHGMR
ncbi:hypothetical protein SOCEGT47_023780 [Sorangium cellulosum]|uniref:Secreted protein n=1 Tax=Sorangium cellulosum TaxID=56 RepID=A0A4V0ND94_SORCE|nr:hypothetical protein [Sorangium cellulosum]AUX21882.1 hypothetical protein SOCEGT47_023780 [Sorangium cellulosum]